MPRVLGVTKVSGVKVSWLFVFLVALEVLCWTQISCSAHPSLSGYQHRQFQSSYINVDLAIQIQLIVDSLNRLASDDYLFPFRYEDQTVDGEKSEHLRTTSDTQLIFQGYDRNPKKRNLVGFHVPTVDCQKSLTY